MKNSLLLPYYLGIVFAIPACQASDEQSDPTANKQPVSITANIVHQTVAGRYAQASENVTAQFTKEDAIGVFMDEAPAVRWTFSGTSWSTNPPMYWPDNQQLHAFHAYYPCTSPAATSRDNVPMPSLKVQSGKWEDVPKYDFLVASHQVSYANQRGNVAFNGKEHSFKHVSTLLKFIIKADGDMQGATINEITLNGDANLFSESTYSFTTQKVNTTGNASSNTLSFQPQQMVNNEDASFYLVVNSKEATVSTNSSLNLTIKYTASDGKTHFVAQKEGISSQLLTGSSYKFIIHVQGSSIVVTGGEISDWTPGNGEGSTLIVNGEEEK